MTEPVSPDVERECRALVKHLVGVDASDYVVVRYARGLDSATFHEGLGQGTADRVLRRAWRTGGIGLSLADTYARFFAPAGEFRRRAVLLGAILESSPDTFAAFEPPPAGRLRAWSALVGAGLLFALRLGVAIVVIGPLHLGARLMTGATANAEGRSG
jgi:hypothetical protein